MTTEKKPVFGNCWSGTLVLNAKGQIVDVADYKEYSLKEMKEYFKKSKTSS